MTIISITLMLLSSLVLAVVFKLKRHKTFIGINLSYSLLLIGLLFYLSKIGGLSVKRMDSLYLSLKNVNIVLHPTKVQDLVEKLKKK